MGVRQVSGVQHTGCKKRLHCLICVHRPVPRCPKKQCEGLIFFWGRGWGGGGGKRAGPPNTTRTRGTAEIIKPGINLVCPNHVKESKGILYPPLGLSRLHFSEMKNEPCSNPRKNSLVAHQKTIWLWVKIKPSGNGPQVFVHVSIYQGSILGTYF